VGRILPRSSGDGRGTGARGGSVGGIVGGLAIGFDLRASLLGDKTARRRCNRGPTLGRAFFVTPGRDHQGPNNQPPRGNQKRKGANDANFHENPMETKPALL